MVLQERLCQHYAYVRPLWSIKRKVDYYAAKGNQIRPNWLHDFKEYHDGLIDHVEETHPFGGDGCTERWEGQHPKPVQDRIDSGEFYWGVRETRQEAVAV